MTQHLHSYTNPVVVPWLPLWSSGRKLFPGAEDTVVWGRREWDRAEKLLNLFFWGMSVPLHTDEFMCLSETWLLSSFYGWRVCTAVAPVTEDSRNIRALNTVMVTDQEDSGCRGGLSDTFGYFLCVVIMNITFHLPLVVFFWIAFSTFSSIKIDLYFPFVLFEIMFHSVVQTCLEIIVQPRLASKIGKFLSPWDE